MTRKLITTPDRSDLPAHAVTRDRIPFSPQQEQWSFRGVASAVCLRFDPIPGTTAAFSRAAKHAFLWFAQHRSLSYVNGLYMTLCHFARTVSGMEDRPVDEITAADLISYRAYDPAHEERLSELSPLIRRWHGLGYPGVDRTAINYRDAVRLRGNRKGEAVLTLDPIMGPLTDLELESTLTALTEAFGAGVVDLGDYLITLLLILLGVRPVQLASMKLRDYRVVESLRGQSAHLLDVPRVKQRNLAARSQHKTRCIPSDVGRLLGEHIRQVSLRFKDCLPSTADAPLFPGSGRRMVEQPGFAFHQDAQQLGQSIHGTLKRIAPLSERTGARLHLVPLRFRRTFAVRLRMEGHSTRVIAELLDHSDLQNVGVYSGAALALHDRVTEAMAVSLAPLLRAFKGQLTADIDPRLPRISDPRSDPSFLCPLGNCGKTEACDFSAPIACYCCDQFRPWLDGPHARVFERACAEHERLARTCDARVAAALVRPLAAIQEVISLCARTKAARTSEAT
jgi:integrase